MAGLTQQKKLEILQTYMNPDHRPLCEKFDEIRRDFRHKITEQIVVGLQFKDRFFTDIVPEILSDAIRKGRCQDAISEAFRLLELYSLNLMHYYWKPEIQTIKRYTGIYRTKLLATLPDVDKFMAKLGYKKDDNPTMDELRLKTYVSRQSLVQIAFDCYIAQKHCEFFDVVSLRVSDVRPGCTWNDVAAMFDTLVGSDGRCAQLILENTLQTGEGPRRPEVRDVKEDAGPPSLTELDVVDIEEDMYQ